MSEIATHAFSLSLCWCIVCVGGVAEYEGNPVCEGEKRCLVVVFSVCGVCDEDLSLYVVCEDVGIDVVVVYNR